MVRPGWPATRASPLCEKRLLESSKRGGERGRARRGTRSRRKDCERKRDKDKLTCEDRYSSRRIRIGSQRRVSLRDRARDGRGEGARQVPADTLADARGREETESGILCA